MRYPVAADIAVAEFPTDRRAQRTHIGTYQTSQLQWERESIMAPRTPKHSVVATSSGGLAFSVAVREHVVHSDQPVRSGGGDSAPTPLELLSAALASCIALYVHKYCTAHALAATDLAVEVNPLWKEAPGRIARFDVVIHLPVTIPVSHHAAIDEIARTCPVHNTLTHSPEITVALHDRASAGAAA